MYELPNEYCHDYTRLMCFFFHNSRVTNEKMHEWDDACVTKERHISHEREEVFITKDATYESRMRAPLTIRKLLKNQILLYFSFLRRLVRDPTVFSFGTHQSFDLWRCPEQKNMKHERGDVRVMNTLPLLSRLMRFLVRHSCVYSLLGRTKYYEHRLKSVFPPFYSTDHFRRFFRITSWLRLVGALKL